jgi:hypothetical protein
VYRDPKRPWRAWSAVAGWWRDNSVKARISAAASLVLLAIVVIAASTPSSSNKREDAQASATARPAATAFGDEPSELAAHRAKVRAAARARGSRSQGRARQPRPGQPGPPSARVASSLRIRHPARGAARRDPRLGRVAHQGARGCVLAIHGLNRDKAAPRSGGERARASGRSSSLPPSSSNVTSHLTRPRGSRADPARACASCRALSPRAGERARPLLPAPSRPRRVIGGSAPRDRIAARAPGGDDPPAS